MIIAQARSIIHSAAKESAPDDLDSASWFLVDGESEDEIVAKLRHRVMVIVGSVLVHFGKSGVSNKTARRNIFHADGAFPMVVEVKWADTAEPQRLTFNVTPDDIVGDIMERMVNGQ